MGATKLYPPTIHGTIPPFYKDAVKGTVVLTVPFTMNKVVSIAEVTGLRLKIKDAETDKTYGEIDCTSWTETVESPSAVFDLGDIDSQSDIAYKLVVGRYYKIQLAYLDTHNSVGYYSTLAITKFTVKPTLSLLHMNRYQTNNDMTQYVGVYTNIGDTTEKAYQYKFTLRDTAGNILETSGWKAHNVSADTEIGQSTDTYNLLYSVAPDEKYTMQYSVLTNNNLECNSVRYQIVGSTSIPAELSADLMATIDYDNGSVDLRLKQSILKIIDTETGAREEPKLSGSFILSRSSSVENFTIWTKLYTFHLTGSLPEGIIFSDYTCEQGAIYHYALQQYNPNGIYSARMLAERFDKDEDGVLQPTGVSDLVINFEDMFLYDGDRQLRIRFNPKVSSFKTVVQEAKKTTLGSQFPFFFRSGVTEYKEFPISGLISYMIDENEYFLHRDSDLHMPKNWQDTTDITDENLTYERRFKLEVLNWLNDGKVKLFRSPAEGNYLVRLMSVQLTPNDSLSRMIHTFQCTATEVDTYTPDKLQSYGFLKADPEIPKQLRFASINLDEYIEMLIVKACRGQDPTPDQIQSVLSDFAKYDILKGFSAQYLKFEDFLPQTEFTLAGDRFQIGSTGSYESFFTHNPSKLYIKAPYRHMPGTITYGILTVTSNSFDTVTTISHRDILDFPVWSTDNYIAMHNTIKDKMNKIYFMRFYLNDLVYEFDSLAKFQNYYGIYMDSEHEEWYNGGPANTGEDEMYMVYLEGTCPEGQAYKYLDEYYHKELIGYDENDEPIYEYKYIQRGANDLYINNTLIRTNDDGRVWQYTLNNPGSHPGMTATLQLIGQETDALHATRVYIDDDIIDLSLTGSAYFPTNNEIPTSVRWGSLVKAEICYQDLVIDYGVEDDIMPLVEWDRLSMDSMRRAVNLSHKYYDAKILQLQKSTVADAAQRDDVRANEDIAYFVWDGNAFHRLSPEERAEIVIGAEVWTCFTHWEWSKQNKCYIYNENAVNTQLYDAGVEVIDTINVGADVYQTLYNTFMAMIQAELEAEEKELIIIDQ